MYPISRLYRFTAFAAVLLAASCESTSTSVARVASVEVEPEAFSLLVGETLQLSAIVRDAAGNLLTGRSVAWSSSEPQVASIDPSGRVTGAGPGVATVRASVDAVTGTGTVDVRTRARIGLSPDEVLFEALRGGADPPTQQIGITNAGEASLVNLEASVRYLDGGPSGWLLTSLSSPVAPSTLTLAASVAGLASGTYRAQVDVSAPGAENSPQAVDVSFTVLEPPPSIELSTDSVEIEAVETTIEPTPSIVLVTNGGGGALEGLAASVVYDDGQPDGWLTTGLAAAVAPTTLEVAATAGTLPVGTYLATVLVDAPGAANAPARLRVVFFVVERERAARP